MNYSHSKIFRLDAKSFLRNFKKWGPCARTCIGLTCSSLTEERLQEDATIVARKFAQDPATFAMQAQSSDASHTLFTISLNDNRSVYTLRVSTPYLRGLVMEEIVKFDTEDQILFYHRASSMPTFRGTLGYMFERYFLVWLYSAKQGNALLCTAKHVRSATFANPLRVTRLATSKRSHVAAGDQVHQVPELRLKPLVWVKMTVSNGVSFFKAAKDSDTPFGWVPALWTFPSFDAVICTKSEIITIQVTVSLGHTMDPDGFKQLKHFLPRKFQSTRTWCHVFVMDCPDHADSLRRQHHQIPEGMSILIYSAVLDVPTCKFFSEAMKRAFTPQCTWLKGTVY